MADPPPIPIEHVGRVPLLRHVPADAAAWPQHRTGQYIWVYLSHLPLNQPIYAYRVTDNMLAPAIRRGDDVIVVPPSVPRATEYVITLEQGQNHIRSLLVDQTDLVIQGTVVAKVVGTARRVK